MIVIARLTPIPLLSLNDPDDRLSLATVLLVIALVGFLAYRFGVRLAARLIAPRGKRFEIPSALIVPCLAEADFPCPRCAYNLRGLTQPACPECSEPVRLAMIDYKARTPGGAFGLVLAWLLTSTCCSLLMSVFAVKIILNMYEMVASMSSRTFPGGAPIGIPAFLFPYLVIAVLPIGSFFVCATRLVLLLSARGEAAARWSRSTTLALTITASCWMLVFTLFAALFLLR